MDDGARRAVARARRTDQPGAPASRDRRVGDHGEGARAPGEAEQRWHLLLESVLGLLDLPVGDLLDAAVELAVTMVGAAHASVRLSVDGQDRSTSHGPAPRASAGGAIEVSLTAHGDQVGRLEVVPDPTREKLTDQDHALLTSLGHAVGAILGTALAREEAARREEWLAAAADLTWSLLDSGDDCRSLQHVADRMRDLAGADVSWVVEAEDEELVLRVVSGIEVAPDTIAGLDLRRSLAREVVRTGRPVSVEDLGSDPRAFNVGLVLGTSLGPAVMVPMRHGDDVIGVVALAWRRRSGPGRTIDPSLPLLFADQAALALRVARTHREHERLVLREDRDRIARDLHDLVIQRLFALGLGLQATSRLSSPSEVSARLDRAVHDIDDRIRDIRKTVFALGVTPGSDDVRASVADVVDRVAGSLSFRPELEFTGPVASQVDPELVPDLVAALTESLSNVVRHARATSCSVELGVVGDDLRLRVCDDGVGVPENVVESGLANMRDRARARGGDLTVTSGEGGGSELVWWVPLD